MRIPYFTSLKIQIMESFKVSAEQLPRFLLLKQLGEALVEFNNTTPQSEHTPGKITSFDGRDYPINAAPVNLDYFKIAARIFNLAEDLGYKDEISKKLFPATVFSYPQAFEKMKTGSIEGIEAPVSFAKGACKQIAMCFYEENAKLSDLYKPLIKEKSLSSFREFAGSVMGQAQLDRILTDIARESPEYIGPAGQPMELHGRIHPQSLIGLSMGRTI